METRKTSLERLDQDKKNHHQPISLVQFSQTHPYQYLKQLNIVYQACNKSTGRDYSTASKIKLPWKKFKPVSIPRCFKENYNLERKQIIVMRSSVNHENSEQVENERRFWKEHQELMKKYHRNNIISSNLKKPKMLTPRTNLISAKSYSSTKTKQQSWFVRKNTRLFQNSLNCSSNKQNNAERLTSLKTQFDQTQISYPTQSKEFICTNKKDINISSNGLQDGSTNYTCFGKNKSQKSKWLNPSMSVQEEVLQKLKKISMIPYMNRAKTATIFSRQGKSWRFKKANQRQFLDESRVKQSEYLDYNLKEELIVRYKSKIKQIDCSISQKNVIKTAAILRQMQELASTSIEKY